MMIRVQNLTKEYGTQKAIDNISFEVKSGEIVGFLGPNGAGKTTTMKIITCLIPPSSGEVQVGEWSIHEHSLQIRSQIGYLPEHNPLYLDLYVHEYLQFVAELYQLPSKQIPARIAEMIQLTGLTREQHKKIGALSKGYRQRVGLAQALIHNPPILILDEPTTGLDPNQIVEIRELIREIAQEKTIIFSTHILPEVEAIADRVIIINRGKLMLDEPIQNLKNRLTTEILIRVEFEKPNFQWNWLLSMEGVIRIHEISALKFEVFTKPELDIRKLLYEQSVSQNNSLLSLHRETSSLEDIFREVTWEQKAKV
ncbi:MAG: gliding motility-associated ABC transporter ATP-binding subunit GldA [Bacteroidia bacterium]|nr:gliding motility-associated ABC transporter ATP-binding subunit GldA [Bacteroidia bacterium]